MKVAVLGMGGYFRKKRESINGDIEYFLDNFKTGEFEGKPIIKPAELDHEKYDKLYVMSNSYVQIVYQLLELGIPREKIIIGANLEPYNEFETNFLSKDRILYINSDNKFCYKFDEIEIAVNTFDELYNIRDIFADAAYKFYYSNSPKIVLDIGMNVGGAAVYFALRDDVKKVYGYEPFKNTFELAEYNTRKCSKIVPYNCGIGESNKKEKILFNPSMTCGMSTIRDINNHAHEMYSEWGWIDENKSIQEEISIVDIVDECEKIFNKHQECEYVLKMDCEGSEYAILEKMNTKAILNRFSIIMLEWHYKGTEIIEEYLRKNNFAYFSFAKSNNMGTIYAFNKAFN